MRKYLFAALLLLGASAAMAENETVAKPVTEQTGEVAEVITRKVEKKLLPVPECNDEKLLAKTKEFLTAYFAKSDNKGVIFRRRKHFMLNGLADFTTENIANYKSAATRPISDIIIELQMNEKIVEENMRLCKKASVSKVLGDLYLLVYPYKEGYKVHILNLDSRNAAGKNTFEY